MAIGVLIMLTSPTSTHALMQAGFDDGIEPVTRPGKRGIRSLDASVTQDDEADASEGQDQPGIS